jgi:hypothetical protein
MAIRSFAASIAVVAVAGSLVGNVSAASQIRTGLGKLPILPAATQGEKSNKSCQKKPESSSEQKLLTPGTKTVEKRNTPVACEQPPKSGLNLGSLSKTASAATAILG